VRLVEVFESCAVAAFGQLYGLRLAQIALVLSCDQIRHNVPSKDQIQFPKITSASSSFLFLPALPHIGVPTVPAPKPAMEEVVALFAGNLEADESRSLPGGNGLLAFTADDRFSEFHN
jgi:hypothetical protein